MSVVRQAARSGQSALDYVNELESLRREAQEENSRLLRALETARRDAHRHGELMQEVRALEHTVKSYEEEMDRKPNPIP